MLLSLPYHNLPELEREDHVNREGGFFGTIQGSVVDAEVAVSSNLTTRTPVVLHFWTNRNLRMWLNVQTTGQCIDRRSIIFPPFSTATNSDAISHLIDQVLVDRDDIVVSTISSQQVIVEDVVQLIVDLPIQNGTGSVSVTNCTEVADAGDVCEADVV